MEITIRMSVVLALAGVEGSVSQIDNNYVLDLESFETRSERSAAWTNWIPNAFPGLSVQKLTDMESIGLVQMVQFGPARVYSIIQSSQLLRNHADQVPEPRHTAGCIYQKSGRSEFRTHEGSIQLTPGAMVMADGGADFQIESIGMTQTYVVNFPRAIVMERATQKFPSSGLFISQDTPLLGYLVCLIEHGLQEKSRLGSAQKIGVFNALFELFVAMPSAEYTRQSNTHWRVKQAIERIHTHASDPLLNANTIAEEQNISRRRLDQIFRKEIDSTISFQISERRLILAAGMLCDQSKRDLSITAVAYASGFEDSSHFSRAFKLRFGVAPRQWRAKA